MSDAALAGTTGGIATSGDVYGADDAALVTGAQRDPATVPAAFETLYRRYVDQIHRYCYRRLGNREAAEDATSQVFMKALITIRTCRPEGFRPWLYGIAHHVTTDHRRSQRPVAPINAAGEVPDAAPTPEDAALAAEAEETVVQLLARLPVDQRRVVELRLAKLTSAEVAQVLGRSLPAVKIAQVRAYARLRGLLGVGPTRPEEVRHG
jgi:RNA polymerase sigma-70 factor (ECF subfamily)